jgi:hypothetical protein
MVPSKQPVLENGKQTFKPSMDHFSQQSVAVDVLTGQPVSIGSVPSAPVIPQLSNAPVQVATTVAPVQAMQSGPMPTTVDLSQVKSALLKTYNNPSIDGRGTVTAVLTEAGVPNLAMLDSTNASRVVEVLMRHGVSL